MSERETVSFEIEVREAGSDGRTLEALVVPYGETSTATPYEGGERFLPGAFKRSVGQFRAAKRSLLLFRSHDHTRAIGKSESLTDTPEGLLASFRLARTPEGDAAIQEFREGILPGMSVGFRAIRDQRGMDGAREVIEAALLEASMTPMGAYDNARGLALRTPAEPLDLAWVTVPPAPIIDLSRPASTWR
jgi:HK97 family phage prohead protease